MAPLSTLLWTSAKPIIKFVILGGCGALMARHGMLSPAGSKVISGLILNYTLPALLFAKMVTCVNLENVRELGLVALVAIFYIAVGAFFGVLIQKIGRVPKRLYRGIIAASMFTNFGDLPISIILAVSDHPPFLVGDGARGTAYSSVFISVFYLFLFPLGGYRLIRYDHVREAKRLQSLSATTGTDGDGSTDSSSITAGSISRDEYSGESTSGKPHYGAESYPQERPSDMEAGQQIANVAKRVPNISHHQPRKPSPLAHSSNSPTSTIISIECSLDSNDNTRNTDEMDRPSSLEPFPESTPSHRNLTPATWQRERSHTSASSATTITPDYVHAKEVQKPKGVDSQTQHSSSSPSSPSSSYHSVSPSPLISHSPLSTPDATEPSHTVLPLPKVPPQLERSHTKGARPWRLFHGTREYLTPPTLGLLLGLLVALTPLRPLFLQTAATPVSADELPPLSFILEITLMLGGCCVPLGLTVLGASLSRLKPGRMRPLVPALTLLSLSKMVLSPLIGICVVQVLVRRYYGLVATNHMLQFTLMLMSGSPTSITCFVLAQVWDRRTLNAGSEMAALIAVQYAVATVAVTVQSVCMMYFLF